MWMLKFGERVYIKVIIYEAVSRDLFAATRAHQLFSMFSSRREEIKRTSGRSPFCLSRLAVRKLDSLGISPITRKMTSHSKRSPLPDSINLQQTQFSVSFSSQN